MGPETRIDRLFLCSGALFVVSCAILITTTGIYGYSWV
jgi:hypothetical protein